MATTAVEWSFGREPEAMIEVWSTAALIETVLAALLEDPDRLRLALRALGQKEPA